MKTFTPLRALTLTLALVSGLVGCAKDDDERRDDLRQNQIQNGTYKSDNCYTNKQETQLALGTPRFSLGMLTINENGTGTGQYTVYSDPACTQLVGTLEEATKNQTFAQVTVVSIDGVSVLRLVQDGSILNPTWWIPANVSSSGYSLDVNFADGESGPYLGEPSPTDVASFKANPGQGVAFSKQ